MNERHGRVAAVARTPARTRSWREFALSVNPFDVQEQADAIHRALTMSAEERSWRAEGLKRIVTRARPGRLGRRPAARTSRPSARGARRSDRRRGGSGSRVGCELPAARRREDRSRRRPPGGRGRGWRDRRRRDPVGMGPGRRAVCPGAALGTRRRVRTIGVPRLRPHRGGPGQGGGLARGLGRALMRGAAATAARGDQHRGRRNGRHSAHIRPPQPAEQPRLHAVASLGGPPFAPGAASPLLSCPARWRPSTTSCS